MFFLVFHGKERMDDHTREHLRESPWVVTGPLILLAIPSLLIGYMTIGDVLFGGYFGDSIVVHQSHDVLAQIGAGFTSAAGFMTHGLLTPAFWFSIAGLGCAWFIYMRRPDLADFFKQQCLPLFKLLDRNYGCDDFNDKVFAAGSRKVGNVLSNTGDAKLIDGYIVNGSANVVGWFASVARYSQTGYLYHYAFAMILGLVVLLTEISEDIQFATA